LGLAGSSRYCCLSATRSRDEMHLIADTTRRADWRTQSSLRRCLRVVSHEVATEAVAMLNASL
jgi:hypothetical protein